MSTKGISNKAIRRSLNGFGLFTFVGPLVSGFFRDALMLDLNGLFVIYLSERYATEDRTSVRWSLIVTACYVLVSLVGLATTLGSHLRMGVFGPASLFEIGFQLVRGVWAAALFVIIRRDAARLKRERGEAIPESSAISP